MSLNDDVITLDGDDLNAVLSLDRQINFAAVGAANDTVIQAQHEVIETIPATFDVTNPWYLPGNLYGIHYTRATPDNPTASLHTNAYWLVPHETGSDKQPHDGEFLAIPTEEIKPPHQAVPRDKRPANLPDSFVMQTGRGLKIFQRLDKRIQAAYTLVKRVHIKRRSTVVDPTVRIVENNFASNLFEKLKEALKTAK